MKPYLIAAALLLGACASDGPKTLQESQSAHTWHSDNGKSLNAAFVADARRSLKGTTRAEALDLVKAAGYECQFGEAHENYPDPMAVCTRSFATRACQMDWEVSMTADKGKTKDVDASFTRDCVGTDLDYPEKKKSAIDDQLAPPSLPKQ
jgi:hypothetical protein